MCISTEKRIFFLKVKSCIQGESKSFLIGLMNYDERLSRWLNLSRVIFYHIHPEYIYFFINETDTTPFSRLLK